MLVESACGVWNGEHAGGPKIGHVDCKYLELKLVLALLCTEVQHLGCV